MSTHTDLSKITVSALEIAKEIAWIEAVSVNDEQGIGQSTLRIVVDAISSDINPADRAAFIAACLPEETKRREAMLAKYAGK